MTDIKAWIYDNGDLVSCSGTSLANDLIEARRVALHWYKEHNAQKVMADFHRDGLKAVSDVIRRHGGFGEDYSCADAVERICQERDQARAIAARRFASVMYCEHASELEGDNTPDLKVMYIPTGNGIWFRRWCAVCGGETKILSYDEAVCSVCGKNAKMPAMTGRERK